METLINLLVGEWQPAVLFLLSAHLIVGGGLLAVRSANTRANQMLGLLLLALAGIGLRQVFILVGLFEQDSAWMFLPIANDLALAPLIVGYVYWLTGDRLPLPANVMFAPAGLYVVYMVSILMMPDAVRLAWYEGGHQTIAIPIMTAIALPSTIAATWACWRRCGQYRRWLDENSSARADFEVRGLDLALLMISAPVLGWVVLSGVHAFGGPTTPQSEYPFYLLLAMCGYALALTGHAQPHIDFPKMEARGPAQRLTAQEEATAPSDGELAASQPQARYRELAEAVRDRVKREEWHTEPRLSRADLARRCNMSENALSQALNLGLGMNFNRFINAVRIEAVQDALAEGADDILGLALDVGFNSKATFNRVFKDHVGLTPTAFRTKALEAKERAAQPPAR
jgi:AraC-like DNA-binding protein